jgi:hypothetical protein
MSITLGENNLKEEVLNFDDETSSDDDENLLHSIIPLQDRLK